MAEPVTYPGGTQWAIKHNCFSFPHCSDYHSEESARQAFSEHLHTWQTNHPDNPELWPELVTAQITWQVVE